MNLPAFTTNLLEIWVLQKIFLANCTILPGYTLQMYKRVLENPKIKWIYQHLRHTFWKFEFRQKYFWRILPFYPDIRYTCIRGSWKIRKYSESTSNCDTPFWSLLYFLSILVNQPIHQDIANLPAMATPLFEIWLLAIFSGLFRRIDHSSRI